MHAAGLFRMGVDVDRHDVFDIGQFQFGHLRIPRRVMVAFGKLIILYNELGK
jgi:hypothetical protein